MRVIIAGGGTAGHINPGIAIARSIQQRNPDAEIIFIGTQRGLEVKLVPREGFELKLIKVRGFRRKLSLDTVIAVKELLGSLAEARKIIKEFKPDFVIGTGGYVCGPVVFAASRMKIPTLIHEQNAFPGVTNKILSRFVNSVAISFKEAEKYFTSAKNMVLTGNPVRNEISLQDRESARKQLNIQNGQSLVVIMGGSRGAEKVNEAVVDLLSNYYVEEECRIIFATGEAQFDKVCLQLKSVNKEFETQVVEIRPYIYDMALVLAAADLVIARAGAITISELTVLGIPAILIPSPYVTANHQEYNARALEKQGAAVVILEKDLSGELLHKQMMHLLDDRDQLNKMSKNSKKMGISNAGEKIYSIIQTLNLNKQ